MSDRLTHFDAEQRSIAQWHGIALGAGVRCFAADEDPQEMRMARQVVHTPRAPAPPATYSQAVKAAGLVFVSGTLPVDPRTGRIQGDSIEEQTGQCLANISAILDAAGTSMARLVTATVILAHEDDFAGMDREWLRWFPATPPARQGAKLPVRVPGLLISIAAVAEA